MTSQFETLIYKLATVVEITQQAEGESVSTPEMKQALVRAVRWPPYDVLSRNVLILIPSYVTDQRIQRRLKTSPRYSQQSAWG